MLRGVTCCGVASLHASSKGPVANAATRLGCTMVMIKIITAVMLPDFCTYALQMTVETLHSSGSSRQLPRQRLDVQLIEPGEV